MPRPKKNYRCPKCKKFFKKKCSYEYHVYEKINPCTLMVKNEHGELIDPNKHKKYRCKYCGKFSSNKSNFNRHTKRCEEKFKIKYESIICHPQIREEIEKEIYDSITEKGNVVINNNTTINNHGTINNHNTINNVINNTINGNIIINNYGSEKMDHIDDKFFAKLFDKPEKSVPNLIKEIHFSKKAPINRNLYLNGPRDNVIYIHHNGDWLVRSKDRTLSELIAKNFDRIDDFYEGNKSELGNKEKVRYERYADKYDNNENRFVIRKDVNEVIHDASRSLNK